MIQRQARPDGHDQGQRQVEARPGARAQWPDGDGTAPQLQARAQSRPAGRWAISARTRPNTGSGSSPPTRRKGHFTTAITTRRRRTAQAVTFQPDWIKEAMGLRVIPEDEAADITVTSGEPGKLVLTHRPHKSSGKTYTRVTILDRGHPSDPGAPAPERRSEDDPGTRRGARGLQDRTPPRSRAAATKRS